jgi:transcriptional regulator with XRE-family HTH domain
MDAPDTGRKLKGFGRNLRRARVARDITQEALAERADLNLRTVQRIEAGETNILVTTAMRLRRGIGCPWDELMLPEDL